MFILDISIEGVAWDVIEVTRERISLGRRAESDVQLLDPTVSGQHAVISVTLGDVWIEDVGSTNGTYVNETLIRRQLLRSGDVITIGRHRIECSMPDESQEEDFNLSANAPAVPVSDSLEREHVDALADLERTMRRVPEGDALPVAWLHLKTGPHAGRRLKLDQKNFSLGAFRQRLAVVSRRPTGYYLLPASGDEVDAASAPRVNGDVVPEGGCPLSHRDVLDIGGVEMEFVFES